MPRTSVSPINSKPSFLHTLREGMAFGAGSSIGHRMIDMMIPHKAPIISEPASSEYEQCMKKYDDVSACKRILETD